MPYYQYQAVDRAGNRIEGAIQANSPDQAAVSLARQGLQVRMLQAGAAPPSLNLSAIDQAPALSGSPRPSLSKPIELASPQQVNFPDATSRPPSVLRKTKWGSDKHAYFIFNQLASYMRSGINPQQAFGDVANRAGREDYRESLMLASQKATEGGRVSEIFSEYPYLYPPHVVGITRAAEQGGFLMDGFQAIADQAQKSIKFRRLFVWLGLTALMVIGCAPLMMAATHGALGAWDAQEKAGGELPGFPTYLAELWRVIKWPFGPATLLFAFLLFAGAHIWQAMPTRAFRHRLVLWVPTVGTRARSESLAMFSWTLSLLSKGGAYPQMAWMMAAAAMPNVEMRRRLEESGARMGERGRLSVAMRESKVIPPEQFNIVETGEVTGDIPGALMSTAQASSAEFESVTKFAGMRVGCWILLLIGVGSAILLGLFYRNFYGALIPKVLAE